MNLDDLTFEVRDINLNRIGQIVPQDLDVTLEEQYNNVGSWTIRLRSDHPLAPSLRLPGAGLVVSLNGTEMFSGPTVKVEDAATSEAPGGVLQVDGVTDTVALADRLCVPDPTNPNLDDQGLAHDIRVGNVEDLMFAFVNANAGPGATSNRRTGYLTMGTNGHRGPSIRKSVRFTVLGNTVGELAALINLGFRVIQRGSGLVFETYTSTDRRADVRLDIYNSTLAGHRVAKGPPTVTRVLVAGQGDLTERTFLEVTNSTAISAESTWGRRIELFKDQRQTDDSTELDNAGKDELEKGGHEMLSVQVVPMEDSALDYGREWFLGDWVTVIVNNGEVYSQVTGYILKANKTDIFKFGAIMGDPTSGSTQSQAQTLESRVANLEKNAENPLPTPILSAGSYVNSTAPTAYPFAESRMYISSSQGTSGAWGPHIGRSVTGEVLTYRWDDGAAIQTWRTLGTGSPEEWMRNGTTAGGWGPWITQQNVQSAAAYGITGEIKLWTTTSAPTGWALADGSAISRTTYASLFAVIGTTYGTGDGSTTFNIPNLKTRVPVGRDGTIGAYNTLGNTGGAETVTLTTAQMPAHSHTIAEDTTNGWAGNTPNSVTKGASGFVAGTLSDRTGSQAASTLIGSTGGGGSHNNMPPYIVLNYIIKL